jgi:hypothetical protein
LPDWLVVAVDWGFLPQNGKVVKANDQITAKKNLWKGLVVDNESKCPVSGKRKYASEGEALATAAHQIAIANAPKELRAYLCSWCDAWHLTKNTGRAGKDRR